MNKDPRLVRLDSTRLKIVNDFGVDATLFANERVPVESSAVDELASVVSLQGANERLADQAPDFFEAGPSLRRVAVTPDCHKGAGIPVGTVLATRGYVVPQAVGNDINCGMRLHVTSLPADRVAAHLDDLEARFRHSFFEGGRDIPMTRVQREALFREGLLGLLEATGPGREGADAGLWPLFREMCPERDLDRVHGYGSLPANDVCGLDDFLGPARGLSRDGQIGSIGGGNHFVEVQRVHRILNGTIAHAWGLKEGRVTVMVHTGSVAIGHHCGNRIRRLLRQTHPAGAPHPENGLFLLPAGERHREAMGRFRDALHNAANFAFANRLFLALMALRDLGECCGGSGAGSRGGSRGAVESSLLYDAPHNLVWEEQMDGEPTFLHRKGACPARGFEQMRDTPFAYHGEPVLVPGSMGASSFVLAGRGNAQSLWSASHGAGRALSRGDALRGDEEEFRAFLAAFRVVTPVDLRRPDVAMRRDIVDKKLEDLKKEAPFAYKGIGPVVDTLREANIAEPVAELTPLMTIKG